MAVNSKQRNKMTSWLENPDMLGNLTWKCLAVAEMSWKILVKI